MAGPLTESEELELLELEAEEAAAQQSLGRRRPAAQGSIPLPDFAQEGPVNFSSKGEGIVDIVKDRFNRQSEMADKFERQGLARRADEAGQEARSKAAASMGDVSPLVQAMTGSALDMAQQAGARGVYNEAGVMRPSDAFGVNILNAEGMGIPGFTSQTMRDQLRQAHSDQPVPAIAGEIAGSVIPGEGLYRGAKGLYGATLKPVITRALPKGGSLAAQGTRLATHGAEQVGIWAGQNAAFRGTTGASVDAAMEGRAPTFGDVVEGAREGATDPINMIGGAGGIGLSRVMRFVGSGGRTSVPADRADFVSSLSGRPSGSGTVLNAERFGDIDPLAEKQLVRLLGSRGYTRDDIAGALSAFEDASQGIVDDALLPARLKDIFVEHLGPGAAEPIDGFLQGASNRSGTQGAATVQAGVAEDAGRLSQFVNDSAENRFGSANRFDTSEAAKEEMARLGREGYEPILSRPVDPESAAALVKIMNGPGMTKLREPLDTIAAGEGIDLAAMMEREPLRAAHWMQSKARALSQAQDPAFRQAYSAMRTRLLNAIEEVAPDYRAVRQTYGDEFSNAKALTFGDRFVSMNGSSITGDEMKLGQMLKELEEMTPTERDSAMLSIRDSLLRSMMRKTEGGVPRMASVAQEPTLAALERLGPQGASFANDVRAVAERIKRNQRISAGTGSNTMNKQEASAFAERAVSNPITRNIGNALQNMGGDAAISGATGFFSPVMTGRAMLRGVGNALAKGRQGKIDNLTDLLMRDAGGAPRRPMSGDGPLPTPTVAPVNALAEGVETGNPVSSRAPVSSAGAPTLRSDIGAAAVGGAVGGLNPDFNGDGTVSNGERIAGIIGGAGGTFGAKKAGGTIARQVGEESRASVSAAHRKQAEATYAPFRPQEVPKGTPIDERTFEKAYIDALDNFVYPSMGVDPTDLSSLSRMEQMRAAYEAEQVALKELRKAGHGTTRLGGYEPDGMSFEEFARQHNETGQQITDSVGSVIAQETGGGVATPEQFTAPGAPSGRDFDLEGWSPGKPRSSGFGGFRSDAGNALAGGAVGGVMPDENGDFSPTNALIGAAGGAVAGRIGPSTTGNALAQGVRGKTPKIMKDVPIGTPKGPAKLSRTLKDVMKDEVPMQGIAKATGDEATMMDARAKEATAMLKGGKTAAEVYKATRLVPIEYKGGRIYIDSGDKTPDEVLSLFYQAVSLPRSQQPQWVRGVLDDLDPLVLENGKPPLLLDKPLAGGARR